jgi:hypothetical protein
VGQTLKKTNFLFSVFVPLEINGEDVAATIADLDAFFSPVEFKSEFIFIDFDHSEEGRRTVNSLSSFIPNLRLFGRSPENPTGLSLLEKAAAEAKGEICLFIHPRLLSGGSNRGLSVELAEIDPAKIYCGCFAKEQPKNFIRRRLKNWLDRRLADWNYPVIDSEPEALLSISRQNLIKFLPRVGFRPKWFGWELLFGTKEDLLTTVPVTLEKPAIIVSSFNQRLNFFLRRKIASRLGKNHL